MGVLLVVGFLGLGWLFLDLLVCQAALTSAFRFGIWFLVSGLVDLDGFVGIDFGW